MVIAIGSYPIGRRFESHRRYQRRQAGLAERFCKRRRAGQPNTAPWSSGLRRRSFAEAAAGSCLKNFAPQAQASGGDTGTKKENTAPWSSGLRHRPFTAVTRVRVPVGSPNKLKANPFLFGDGFAFKVYFKNIN